MSDEVSEELIDLYKQAGDEGFFVKEFSPGQGGKWMAAVGDQAVIDAVVPPITVEDLGLGWPGNGDTREEAVRDALDGWRKHKETCPHHDRLTPSSTQDA